MPGMHDGWPHHHPLSYAEVPVTSALHQAALMHPALHAQLPDVRLASHAMNALQGYVLFSSDRGGVRIEYAKNKMGEVSQPTLAI